MENSEIISIMAANEDLVKNLQRIKTGDRIRVVKHETSQTLESSTEFSVMEKLSEKELQEGAFSEFRFKVFEAGDGHGDGFTFNCLLYTSPSPRDRQKSRMPSSA